MLQGHPEICLYRPEIPQNTGNIGRLAAATQCRLHLILPLGFGLEDKNVRRAGLDYWPYLDLEIHQDHNALFQKHGDSLAILTTKAKRSIGEIPASTSLVVFGQESKGLPADIHDYAGQDRSFRIPLYHKEVRSLNLANAAAIVVYLLLAKSGKFR